MNIINFTSKKSRFISSSISTLLFAIGSTFCLTIGQFSVYITSYFHYQGIDIDMQYGNFMSPVLNLCLALSIPLSGILDKKIGMKLTLLISSVSIEVLLFLFIIQTNKILTMILVCLIGMSLGLGVSIPMKNLCHYYPEKKGLVGSCSISCMTIIGALISVFGESFINPDAVVLQKGDIYYPEDISSNYIQFYKIALVIIPITSLLMIILIQEYDTKYDDENRLINKENEVENKDKKKDENYTKNVKSALLNKRIWLITCIFTVTPFSINFTQNTFRVYGALVSINGGVIKFSGLFSGLSTLIFGPIWGIICDKIRFSIIIKTICILSIIFSLIFFIFIQSNFIYITSVFGSQIITSGFTTISQPLIMQIYGIDYYLIVGGIMVAIGTIFNIFYPVLSYIVSRFYKTGEELRIPYRIIYMVGVGLSVIGFYIGMFEKGEEFVYPAPENGEINKSIENLNKNEDEDNI